MPEANTPPPLATGTLPNGASARIMLGDALTGAERAEMLEVLQAAYDNRWPAFELPVSPAEHLLWKLRGPGAETPSYVTLIETDGLIVHLTVTMREKALVRGRVLDFEGGGDASTRPEYERRGMYTQRRVFELKNIEQWLDGNLGFSLNPTVLRGRARRGEPTPANTIRALLRVYDPRRLAGDRHRPGMRIPEPALAAGFFGAARLGDALSMTSVAQRRPAPTWSLETLTSFDERFDELFAEASRPFDFIKVRSSDYLNWRYADPRGGLYTTLAAVERGRVLGYIVFKMQQGRGYVLDLLTLPRRLDVAHSLVRRADAEFREGGVMGALCWLPRVHPYRGVLRRAGFIDSHQPTGVKYEAYARLDPAVLDFFEEPRAPIHVMLGDSDWQ